MRGEFAGDHVESRLTRNSNSVVPSGAKDEIALSTELTNANPAAKPIWAQMDCVV